VGEDVGSKSGGRRAKRTRGCGGAASEGRNESSSESRKIRAWEVKGRPSLKEGTGPVMGCSGCRRERTLGLGGASLVHAQTIQSRHVCNLHFALSTQAAVSWEARPESE
jgi:hypothetical protein